MKTSQHYLNVESLGSVPVSCCFDPADCQQAVAQQLHLLEGVSAEMETIQLCVYNNKHNNSTLSIEQHLLLTIHLQWKGIHLMSKCQNKSDFQESQ